MNVEVEADGTLILDDSALLPDVLDMLIIGGGPAGTAAAFRAKEFSLTALVVDFDDLMKRIRDYPKDKLILPHYGGGDRMMFPLAGELIGSFQFEDIDKDDMCARWRRFYCEFNVPAKIGVELITLERTDDQLWAGTTWNHRTEAEEVYMSRHVVLALGRGVPRRFDIPGNIDGIAYRLDDPTRYVGSPVCVIGGGTSAAEAVIAISQVKTDAGDPCAVHWSYRGCKMPRVSKALADTFFEAYVANGNTTYHPNSEPVAIVTGQDRKEYLSIRIDRKSMPDRPQETTHLEFAKEDCIACIGEDIPEAFLNDLGVRMVVGGPKEKRMMVVTPLLETQQPNIYLIGDLLCPAYLETEDFDAEPKGFQPLKHRGNIKASLRDGVFIAEVVKQRLDGCDPVEVFIRDAVPPAVHDQLEIETHPGDGRTEPSSSQGPPAGSVPEARPADDVAYLIRTTPEGVEDEFQLTRNGVTSIGRADCDVTFADDTLLSDDHASILHRPEGYLLRDDTSETGTFLQLQHGRPRAVAANDMIRLGRQILVFQTEGQNHFLHHHDQSGGLVNRYLLQERTLVVGRPGGRSDPDLILDGNDPTLSRFHLSVTVRGDEILAEDFNSRNGSFLRVRDAVAVDHADVFRVGRQVFKLRLRADMPSKTGSWSLSTLAAESSLPAPSPSPGTKELLVTFVGDGKPMSAEASDSILDVAENNDVDIDYECRIGMCGCDLIRIVEGHAHLNEPTDQEIRTIERRGLKPDAYRLACMARVSGPVVVEVVD